MRAGPSLVGMLVLTLGAADLGREQTSPVVPQASSAWQRVTITLERTTCFGTCPEYTVTVNQDGDVTYKGGRFVRVGGEQRARVDPASVLALANEFLRIGFFELKSVYRADVTDLPTTYIGINVDGRAARITDYVGAPPELRRLERHVDEVTNSRHWVSLDPAALRDMQRSGNPLSLTQLNDELINALARDDVETASALIDAGANANGDGRPRPPLFSAASAATVRLLVRAGAVVDRPDASGGTPLNWAARVAEAAVVAALLEAGARVDGLEGAKSTPLINAATAGRASSVEILLKAGANPRARTAGGLTALDFASNKSNGCLGQATLYARAPKGMLSGLVPTVEGCRQIIALLEAALAK